MATSTAPLAQAERRNALARRTSREAELAVFPGDKPGETIHAIVKTDERGRTIRNALVRVPLSAAKDEVWTMQRWNGATKSMEPSTSITAIGYDRLNAFIGVSFVTPATVLDDNGTERPNPYLCRDSQTHEIEYVRVRIVGLGRNPVGNLVAHDYTLVYDLRTYLAQDMWSKWTGRKSDAVKEWGRVAPAGPVGDLQPHEKAYAIPAGVVLIVDLRHKDVLAILSEHISRQKFAERNATTICRRNIMKKFTAAAKLDPRSMTVPIVSWQQPDRDIVQLGEMAAQANSGRTVLDGTEIGVERDAGTVSEPEEIEEALHGDVDEEQASDEATGSPAAGVDVPATDKPVAKARDLDELRVKVRDLVQRVPFAVAERCIIGVAGCGQVSDAYKLNDADALTAMKVGLEEAAKNATSKQK